MTMSPEASPSAGWGEINHIRVVKRVTTVLTTHSGRGKVLIRVGKNEGGKGFELLKKHKKVKKNQTITRFTN